MSIDIVLVGGPLDGQEQSLDQSSPPESMICYYAAGDSAVKYVLAPGIAIHRDRYRYAYASQTPRHRQS